MALVSVGAVFGAVGNCTYRMECDRDFLPMDGRSGSSLLSRIIICTFNPMEIVV